MSAEFAGEVTFLGAARDRDGAKTHLDRELDTEMTQSANPEDRDQITGPGAGVAQRIEHGDSRARERRGVNRRQSIGNTGQCARRRYDVFGVAAGKRCAGDHADFAVHEVAAPTAAAPPAMAARPADRHTFTLAPTQHALAKRVDASSDLVTGGDREPQTRQYVVDENRIAVADAAGFHGDPHS